MASLKQPLTVSPAHPVLTEEQIAELVRLEAEATEAPWAFDNRGEKCDDIQIGVAWDSSDKPIAGYFEQEDVTYVEHVAEIRDGCMRDARLICALRNEAGALLAAASSANELRELLREARGWVAEAALSHEGPGGQTILDRIDAALEGKRE